MSTSRELLLTAFLAYRADSTFTIADGTIPRVETWFIREDTRSVFTVAAGPTEVDFQEIVDWVDQHLMVDLPQTG